jgi:hypothetical protein
MRYQFSTKEIGYNTNSAQVEAYRRALEIRQFVLEREGVNPRMAKRQRETFCWETPLTNGCLEIETVTIDQINGTVTYIKSEIAQAC